MGLIVVNDALSQVEGDTLPSTIEPAIATALTRAAPVYRARLWPDHRRANEAWIASLRPTVERIAPSLKRAARTPRSRPISGTR